MEKIKVQSYITKKTKKGATVYTITTVDGKVMDTFDEVWTGGEYEGIVTENTINPAYNANFKIPKAFKPSNRSTFQTPSALTLPPPILNTFEKKKVALQCAVSLVAAGEVLLTDLDKKRDEFFTYLNS